MPAPMHPDDPTPADGDNRAPTLTRRGTRKLARIYLDASAPAAALEALSGLGSKSSDRETMLLRAEAMLGLGRAPEADALLGRVIIPLPSAADTAPSLHEVAILPRWTVDTPERRMSRRDRLDLSRFLLQLRVLHRTGRYRFVVGLGRAFFSTRDLAPGVLVARIASVVAQSMLALRRPVEARALYGNVLALYDGLHSDEGVADTLLGMANTLLLECRWNEADKLYEEANSRYRRMGQLDKALACMVNLGVLRVTRGDLASGRALLLQALDQCTRAGDERRMSTVHLGLALAEIRVGDFAAARPRLLGALRRARLGNVPRDRALACRLLGLLFIHLRRFRRAHLVLAAGLSIAREIAPDGDLCFEILRTQAELALTERRMREARRLAEESQALSLAYGDMCEAAAAERTFAECDAAEGHIETALGRIRSARSLLGRLGETYERARLALLELRLEAKRQGMSVDQVREGLQDVRRAFHGHPRAPILREARGVLAAVRRSLLARTAAPGTTRLAIPR
jgi:tetratricopeptide (TPR) repeat protein